MAKQYGAPDPPPGTFQKGASIKQAEPQANKPDPSPPVDIVNKFHKNAEVDTRRESIHHTIGTTNAQAASGDHSHNGADSVLLLEGYTITGVKGSASWYNSVNQCLVRLGAKDQST